jgi:hypothetical protein
MKLSSVAIGRGLLLVCLVATRNAVASAACQDNLSCNDSNIGLGIINNTFNSSSADGLRAYSLESTAISCSVVHEDAIASGTTAQGTSGVYGEHNACYGYGVAGRSTGYGGLCAPSGVTGVATSTTSTYAQA